MKLRARRQAGTNQATNPVSALKQSAFESVVLNFFFDMDVGSFCRSLSFLVPLTDREATRLSKLFRFHLLLDGHCSFEVDRHLLWFVPGQALDGENNHVDATQMSIQVLLLLPLKYSELDESVRKQTTFTDNEQPVDKPALILRIESVYYLFDHTSITTITVPSTSTGATTSSTTPVEAVPPCIFITLPFLQMRWWKPVSLSVPNESSSSKDKSMSAANSTTINDNDDDNGMDTAKHNSKSKKQGIDVVTSLHSVVSHLSSHLLPLCVGQANQEGGVPLTRQYLPTARSFASLSGSAMRENAENGITECTDSSREDGTYTKRQRTKQGETKAAEQHGCTNGSNDLHPNPHHSNASNGSSETPLIISRLDDKSTSPSEQSTNNSSAPVSTSQPSQHSTSTSESGATSTPESDIYARQVQQQLLTEYPQARIRLQQSLRHWLHVALCLERLNTVSVTPDTMCSSWLDTRSRGDGRSGNKGGAYIGTKRKAVMEKNATEHLLNIAQCRSHQDKKAYLTQQRCGYLLKAHKDKENYTAVANYLQVCPITSSNDNLDEYTHNADDDCRSKTGGDLGMPSTILSHREARRIALTLDAAIERGRSDIGVNVEKMSTANEGKEKEAVMARIRQQVQKMEELYGEISVLEVMPKREYFYEK